MFTVTGTVTKSGARSREMKCKYCGEELETEVKLHFFLEEPLELILFSLSKEHVWINGLPYCDDHCYEHWCIKKGSK